MPVIKAKSIPQKKSKFSEVEKNLAELCYFYPQYTLRDADNLSARQVKLLLSTAVRIQAEQYLTLQNIASAPHTKKGVGVKKMLKSFNKIISDNS